MANPWHKVQTFHIPAIEVWAALEMSRNTAEREGFPRTASMVQGYLDSLEALGFRDAHDVIITFSVPQKRG